MPRKAPTKSTTTTSATAPQNITVHLQPQVVPVPELTPERELIDTLQLPSAITTQVQYEDLTVTLVAVRKARKACEAKEKDLLAPLKMSFKMAVDKLQQDLGLAPVIAKAMLAETKMEQLVTQWHRDERARQQREQAEADAQRRLEMANAKARGENPLTIPERQVAPPPPKTTSTAAGKLTMMKVAKWRLVSPELVPYEHDGEVLWQLNEAAVTRLRKKAGTAEGVVSPIPGIEFYTDETPSVR